MKKPTKVLMFGWEFPPENSGGLGTACEGLVRAFEGEPVDVTFVLPRAQKTSASKNKIVFADSYLPHLSVVEIDSLLGPYFYDEEYRNRLDETEDSIYGKTLFSEVDRYAERAGEVARTVPHDVIHAHDWLSFGAGIRAREISGKPLIAHVHATEYDRTGIDSVGDGRVIEREGRGIREADMVVTVSDYTKRLVKEKYAPDESRMSVVHNGIDYDRGAALNKQQQKESKLEETARVLGAYKRLGYGIALFVARLTLQKGPDYFLRAAKRVLEYQPNTIFVIAGSGDMEEKLMRTAAEYRIADKVLFAGFARGSDLESLYLSADVFVMPSVSEPFGLTALEAAGAYTPVILSKQSGVSEVLRDALRVDFWDTDEMAAHMIAALEHAPLRNTLAKNALAHLPNLSWKNAAKKLTTLYDELKNVGGAEEEPRRTSVRGTNVTNILKKIS